MVVTRRNNGGGVHVSPKFEVVPTPEPVPEPPPQIPSLTELGRRAASKLEREHMEYHKTNNPKLTPEQLDGYRAGFAAGWREAVRIMRQATLKSHGS